METHTLIVRGVARDFEPAVVARTERSIINWCRLNRQGVVRLDTFFDENEGRYYITQQSVTRAIEEERAKQSSMGTAPVSEPEVPNRSDSSSRRDTDDSERVKELELRNRDLEIATRGKDQMIELLQEERGQFHKELMGMSRHVGELETQLLQLGGAPRGDLSLPHSSEAFGKTQHSAESL